jgi:5-methyltetrahydrofolate--homocysteine methyltransferase
MGIYEQIADEIIKGQADAVKELVNQAISEKISAEDILNNGLVAGMNVVSKMFKNNEFFIPEVLVSARAMTAGLHILNPLLAEEIVDLGADVPMEKFIEFTQKEDANVVGMSALLTTTMIYMKEVIQGLKDAGLRDKVKVIIGGAPVTQAYADQIEADGYAPDAASAIDLAKDLLD